MHNNRLILERNDLNIGLEDINHFGRNLNNILKIVLIIRLDEYVLKTFDNFPFPLLDIKRMFQPQQEVQQLFLSKVYILGKPYGKWLI